MRIAIVGAGLTGLSAARLLSEDPRHVTTVFETRARFGGPVQHLFSLGVTLRHTAQVERLAVDDTGVDLWIHGLAECFDLVLVTTSPAEARALLARSGIRRHAGSMSLRQRVYFTEDAQNSAHAALARMAADHPAVRQRPWLEAPRDTRVAHAVRALARRAGGLTAAHVQLLDLSGHSWPLRAPAIYIANQRWILDVVPRHLMIRGLRTPEASDATAGALEAGNSVAFVVEGSNRPRGHAADAPHGGGAALAALAVNAPIVPMATTPAPMRRPRVVIGEPFYPETSSIDELMKDMRMVVRYLERLAVEHARATDVTPLVRQSPSPARARRSFLPRGA
jgi:hypothetical protein